MRRVLKRTLPGLRRVECVESLRVRTALLERVEPNGLEHLQIILDVIDSLLPSSHFLLIFSIRGFRGILRL